MNLLSSNVYTKSLPNYNEDFKIYISGMRDALTSLSKIVEEHGNLVYGIDYEIRESLIKNLELLEVTLIRMLRDHGDFKASVYQDIFEFYTQIASLTVQAHHHDFLFITTMRVQILSDFVLKHTK